MMDALRYLCWAAWLLSLPVALFMLLPLWMSTESALGGSSKNWTLVIIDLAWILVPPFLLVKWGQMS